LPKNARIITTAKTALPTETVDGVAQLPNVGTEHELAPTPLTFATVNLGTTSTITSILTLAPTAPPLSIANLAWPLEKIVPGAKAAATLPVDLVKNGELEPLVANLSMLALAMSTLLAPIVSWTLTATGAATVLETELAITMVLLVEVSWLTLALAATISIVALV